MLLTIGFSDVSRRHRLGVCRRSPAPIFPGGLSDAIYLSCYGWPRRRGARATARRTRPGASAPRRGSALDPGHALCRDAGCRSWCSCTSRRGDGAARRLDDGDHLRADAARHAAPGRHLARRRAAARARAAVGIVEARYASLIKNASDVIMIVDVDGRLRFASPAAERTFGIHPDELVGRNLLDLWSESDRERLAALPRRGRRDAAAARSDRSKWSSTPTTGAARSSAWAATCSTTRPLPAWR